ncbi:MAG: hypothetical protein K2W96_07215 [Gemmataceae bacterium]|nr:hypothetical protein [Gemmataceae bacterium]
MLRSTFVLLVLSSCCSMLAAAGPAKPAPESDEALDLAEQHEAKGDYDKALALYLKAKESQPRWAALSFKVAACQAALGKTGEAAASLRETLAMKSATTELVAQARAALHELLLPKLDDDQREAWREALALIQAGEELKKGESEDPEIRIAHKVHARPFLKAVALLEKLAKDAPDYAPAHLSLGVANEALSQFAKAAAGYRRFLEFGRRHKLPDLEQQAQVRQRLAVCESKHQADEDLARRVPGIWEVSYSEDGGTTYAVSGQIELRPDGKAARLKKIGPLPEQWLVEPGVYWKVAGRRLIVGGDVGKPSEWCNLGTLVSASKFDGLTMELRPARYLKKGESFRETPNKELRARRDGNSILVTSAKTGHLLYRLDIQEGIFDYRFVSDAVLVVIHEPGLGKGLKGKGGRASRYEAATGKKMLLMPKGGK